MTERKRKGIKRHKGLHPLSHHHHHALVAAHRLMKAGTEESKFSLKELPGILRTFWHNEGQQHFREEEELLLPLYARYGSLDRPEIIDMLLEHVKLRSLIMQALEQEAPSAEFLRAIGQLLETHVRKEERVTFGLIEDAIPDEALHHLGPEFTDLTAHIRAGAGAIPKRLFELTGP